jgi:pimeloyl-ACP methyl ester carboxylesterase
MSLDAATDPARASAAAETAHTLERPDGALLAWRSTAAGGAADRSADAVVLIHGLASNLTRFSEFVGATRLATTHRLIRIDLRGHGDSHYDGRLSLESWCDDLAAVLDAEQAARAIVVGHSLGAQVALHFAARHPSRCAALALIDPVYRAALHGKWLRIARLGPLFALAATLVRAANALGLRRRTLPPLDLAELDRQARVALASPAAEAEFIRNYSSTRADLRCFRTAHYLQELVEMFRPVPAPESLPLPVLTLLSTGGTFADFAQTRALSQRYPQASVLTIDCHHWPLTERPVEVREAIELWIEQRIEQRIAALR